MLVGELFHQWKIIFDTKETLEREKDGTNEDSQFVSFLVFTKEKSLGNKNSWVEGDNDEEEEE